MPEKRGKMQCKNFQGVWRAVAIGPDYPAFSRSVAILVYSEAEVRGKVWETILEGGVQFDAFPAGFFAVYSWEALTGTENCSFAELPRDKGYSIALHPRGDDFFPTFLAVWHKEGN